MGILKNYPSLVLHIFFIGVIVFNFGNIFYVNRDRYISHNYWERYQGLKQTYYNSIYANKHGTWIPDEIIYAFAGGSLIKGISPILINPETPPTGKYIIAVSILLFNNENIVVFISGGLVLLLMYIIGRKVYKYSALAVVPPALLSTEPLFKNQFVFIPLLDIFHLLFLLLSFYFFNLALLSKKNSLIWFMLTNLSLGLFISTKFFAVGITLVVTFLFILSINLEIKKLVIYICTLPISVFILLVSYIRVLILGYPLFKFLGIQKWVFWYNEGHLHTPFSVWPLIFLNDWITNGKIIHDAQWRVTWPIATIISLAGLGAFFVGVKKIVKPVQILLVWPLVYLVFLTVADVNARYLVILLPVLFLTSIWVLEALYLYIKAKI